jgi:hypothetical protein
MSTTNIKLKRSSVPGKQPNTSILELGEVALNTYDGKIFIKKDDGAESIVTIQEVTEDSLAIDSSLLDNSTASTLAGVLDDLDAAITTSAGGGLTQVTTDSTLTGLGTAGSPLSVVNDGHSHTVSTITNFTSSVNSAIDTRVDKTFVDALDVDADTLDGANGSFYLDYDNFVNTPTDNDTTYSAGDGLTLTSTTFSVNTAGDSSLVANSSGLFIDDSTLSIATSQLTGDVALGTQTSGNYVATISGTTNEIEVTGSGSETAAVTIGLPDDVTISANLTVTSSASFASGGVNITPTNGGQVDADRLVASFHLLGNHSALHNTFGLNLASNKIVGWNDQTNSWSTAPDTGLARDSAGVVRVTTGTTGTGDLLVRSVNLDSISSLNSETANTATVTQTEIASFASATYSSGKFVIQATDSVSGEVHVTELLIVHDGTTASATEYGTIHTGSSPLATYDVDIDTGNVRVLATAASTNSTTYKVTENLITA